jgi:hypothetical protein
MSAMKRLIAVMVAVIGMVIAAASIGVSASAYPPGTAPTISLSSSSVPPGGSDTVAGVNFTPNSSASLSLQCGGSSADLGVVTTDANGQFSAQITVPSSTPAGTCTVSALDTATGDVATASLTVTSGGGGGAPPPVAGTGVAILSIGGVGLVLLIGGGLLVMAGRRRRATAA